MSERADQDRRRTPRWGFLLAVAAVAFCAADVRAGCGDYVVIASQAATERTPPEPCHGPACSRRPDPIPLAPAAPVTTPVEQAACVFPEAVPPVAGSGPTYSQLLTFDPVTRPFRPERPPRA